MSFIRAAQPQDVPVLINFIKELADSLNLGKYVSGSEQDLHNSLFSQKLAEAVLVCSSSSDDSNDDKEEPVGFAFFYPCFSLYALKPTLYLGGLYVIPSARGKGLGKLLFKHVAALALERDCARFEWSTLAWSKDNLKFYGGMGAAPLPDYLRYQMNRTELLNLLDPSKKSTLSEPK